MRIFDPGRRPDRLGSTHAVDAVLEHLHVVGRRRPVERHVRARCATPAGSSSAWSAAPMSACVLTEIDVPRAGVAGLVERRDRVRVRGRRLARGVLPGLGVGGDGLDRRAVARDPVARDGRVVGRGAPGQVDRRQCRPCLRAARARSAGRCRRRWARGSASAPAWASASAWAPGSASARASGSGSGWPGTVTSFEAAVPTLPEVSIAATVYVYVAAERDARVGPVGRRGVDGGDRRAVALDPVARDADVVGRGGPVEADRSASRRPLR